MNQFGKAKNASGESQPCRAVKQIGFAEDADELTPVIQYWQRAYVVIDHKFGGVQNVRIRALRHHVANHHIHGSYVFSQLRTCFTRPQRPNSS